MNTIRVSIIQDNYSAQPEALDERLKGGELARRSEAYRLAALSPQLELAQAAIGTGTELLVFREDCNGAGHMLHRLDRPDLLECLAEEIPGGLTSNCLSGLAREGRCHVVGCLVEKLDGRLFNTAVLFGPDGTLVGKYHKTHLPPIERLQLTPGDDLPAFDTAIGRIGLLICYDMMTPEAARVLALKGADILCWPSLGYGWWDEAGDFTIRSRAHDNQVYILGALRTLSCVVNPYGNFIAQAGMKNLAILNAAIQPGRDSFQELEHHNAWLTQTPSLRERHLFERRPDLYSTLVDPEPPLARRYPHTHMHDLEQNPKQAFERYLLHLDRLHWITEHDDI